MDRQLRFVFPLVLCAAMLLQSCASSNSTSTGDSKRVRYTSGPHQTGTNL